MGVHYWADLQSVHGFRCYDNIHVCKLIALCAANAYSAEREMSTSACTRCMARWFISAVNLVVVELELCHHLLLLRGMWVVIVVFLHLLIKIADSCARLLCRYAMK